MAFALHSPAFRNGEKIRNRGEFPGGVSLGRA